MIEDCLNGEVIKHKSNHNGLSLLIKTQSGFYGVKTKEVVPFTLNEDGEHYVTLYEVTVRSGVTTFNEVICYRDTTCYIAFDVMFSENCI